MALPKIDHPTFIVEIPSTKQKVTFRPFLVKEEKILLMARASENKNDIIIAIKQIINNCAFNDLDVNNLSLFDIEYVFIKLRASSVSNKVEVTYKDNEDNLPYDFEIDLDKVKVIFPDKIDNKIRINDTAGFTLKYPTASLYEDQEFLNAGKDTFFQLVIRSIDKVYDGDDIYDAKNYTPKELEEFIEDLPVNVFEQVTNFMTKQPYVYYEINYKNSLGNERKIELNSLNDFFTLG